MCVFYTRHHVIAEPGHRSGSIDGSATTSTIMLMTIISIHIIYIYNDSSNTYTKKKTHQSKTFYGVRASIASFT